MRELVNLFCEIEDLESMIAFYVNDLGFFATEGRHGAILLSISPGEEAQFGINAIKKHTKFGTGVSFSVSDIKAAYDDMNEKDRVKIGSLDEVNSSFIVIDPAGNEITFQSLPLS